jgi:hypothetical protein
MPWEMVVVLPNIQVQGAIEANYAALVGPQDERVRSLCGALPVLGTFLASFVDDFGRSKVPAVLLFNNGAPAPYRRSISGFRDAIALSSIPYQRAIAISYDRAAWAPVFANSFDFCPWMVRDDGKWMYSFTPAVSSIDEPTDFKGRTSSEVPHLYLDQLDQPLLSALLPRWERRFAVDSPPWEDLALFRSLNMAFEASRTPFITGGTNYDIGRLVALWVSAFEILAHPGEEQQVNLGRVLGMLAGKREPGSVRPQDRDDRKLRQRIYTDLHEARNDYLHGNPVDDARLVKAPWNLTHYAAPLYRMMLSEFLGMETAIADAPPQGRSEEETGREIARYIHRNGYLRVIQEALRKYPRPVAPT